MSMFTVIIVLMVLAQFPLYAKGLQDDPPMMENTMMMEDSGDMGHALAEWSGVGTEEEMYS